MESLSEFGPLIKEPRATSDLSNEAVKAIANLKERWKTVLTKVSTVLKENTVLTKVKHSVEGNHSTDKGNHSMEGKHSIDEGKHSTD
jgi:hypothetical protein